MESIKLSDHYYLKDLVRSESAQRLKLRAQFTPPVAVINNLSNLCVHVLDVLKDRFPDLRITSGYRCKELNNHVGGVPGSQHIKGMAADIQAPDIDKIFDFIKLRSFDQLIRYDTFIHISYDICANRNMIIDKRDSSKK